MDLNFPMKHFQISCIKLGYLQMVSLMVECISYVSQTEIYPVQNWSLAMPLEPVSRLPAPVLDKIFGPMGARFLSSTGLGSGNRMVRAQVLSVSVIDKIRSPNVVNSI